MTINLFAISGNICAAVNPPISAILKQSTGSNRNTDFTRNPTYSVTTVQIEVQALSSDDLKQIENINIQGELRAVYIVGEVEGIDRSRGMGGDILTFYGADWLVVQQLEEWGNGEWSKLIVRKQTPASA